MTSGRVRTLLVRLALSAGEIVGEEALVDALWPDGPPKSVRTALQTHVGALRDLLEPDRTRRSEGDYVFHRHGGYQLELGAELDTTALRDAVDRAETIRADRPNVATSLLEQALAGWSHDPLAEFADAPWCVRHASALAEYANRAITLLAEIDLAEGRHAEAIPRLEAAIADRPFDERLAALLMAALTRSGRQTDALAVYTGVRSRLVEELGVEPGPGLREAEREVLAQETGASPRRRRRLRDDGSLFVGRVSAQEELRRRLTDHRLVTLVGPGGVGKSRLARRVAGPLAEEWGADAVLVDLTDSVAGNVASEVAVALGATLHDRVRPADAILASVEAAPTILVLDTCEHRLDEVQELVDELAPESSLRIVATRRTPLGHRHELVLPVEPLSTEEAIRLMLERAGLSAVDDHDRVALGEICRRLDGLPLAVELAAGRLRTLTPDQLANLIARGRAALTGGTDRPPRHRALSETIAWSHDLLDDDDRAALRSVACLHGPFTEAMVSGLRGDSDRADSLLHLLDRSLVSPVAGDPGRFRVLDTVRDYVMQVSDRADRREATDRHADWVLSCLLNHFTGGSEPTPTDLAAEIAPALDHLGAGELRPEELTVLLLLGTWWIESSRVAEGRRRCADALSRHTQPSTVRTGVGVLHGLLAWYMGDGRATRAALEPAIPALEEAGVVGMREASIATLALCDGDLQEADAAADRMLAAIDDDDPYRMFALFTAGNISLYCDDPQAALARYLLLRDGAEHRSLPYQVAQAIRFQALATALIGSPDAAWALAERGLSLVQSDVEVLARTQAHAILGMVAHIAGDAEVADDNARRATRLARASFDAFSLRTALPVVSATAASRGDLELAAVASGWLSHLLVDRALPHAPASARVHAAAARTVGDELGDTEARRRFARAAALDLGDLVERIAQG